MHVATEPLLFGFSSPKTFTFFCMSFEQSLKGGHPNSLGNTLKVVDAVLGNTDKMEDLLLCYQSDDETIRLRTSNAFKRIFRAKPDLFKQWKKRFIKEVSDIDQPSAKWTSIQILNDLFDQLDENMIDSINKEGGNAKLTIYEVEGHDADVTFKKREVYEWLNSLQK